MGLLSSYPTATTLDSTDVFPFAGTDNKVKTITAPALVAALYTLDPPPAASTGSGPVVGVNPSLSVPELSNWTLRSAAAGTTMTQPVTGGPIVLYLPIGTDNQMQMATVPVPSTTPWTKTILVEWEGGLDEVLLLPLLILYNSSTDSLIWGGLFQNEASVQYWSSPTSPGATLQQVAHGHPQCDSYWYRVTFDGANISIFASKNNVVWWPIGESFSLASTSLAAITDIGIGQNTGAGAAPPNTMFIWNLS